MKRCTINNYLWQVPTDYLCMTSMNRMNYEIIIIIVKHVTYLVENIPEVIELTERLSYTFTYDVEHKMK